MKPGCRMHCWRLLTQTLHDSGPGLDEIVFSVAANRDARNLLVINGGNFSVTHVRQLAKTSERHAAQHLQLRLDGLRGAAARLLAR